MQIDRERAADLGVDTEDIATALRLMVGGDDEVTRFRDASVNDDYDVQLRLTEARSQRPGDARAAARAARRRRAGAPRQPGEASSHAESPSRIDRLDRQRQVNVRANVAPGYALADRMRGAAAGAPRS